MGLDTYDAFYTWSVTNPEHFWAMVIDELDIQFDEPPDAIVGTQDPKDPQWLPGASFNIVSSCVDHGGDATAIVSASPDGLVEVSVDELRNRVADFAAGIERSGFGIGDRIAIVMPMTTNAVVAYLGIVAAGGVVVSIADSFAADEVAARLAITNPVAIVTQDHAVRLGKSLPMYQKCRDASDIACIIVDTGHTIELRDGDVMWDDFVVPNSEFLPISRLASDHTNILFSSGTTGEPKAIPWTQTTPIKAAMDGRFHQDIH